jgi:hypothetical protein
MWCVCHGHGLYAMCVAVAGAMHGVAVMVFLHVMRGYSCYQYAAYVAVTVFMPCVVVAGVACQVTVMVFMCVV